MKISEMTNDQATKAMIRLSGPFAAICDDDEMTMLLDELKNLKEGESVLKNISKLLPRFVAFGVQKHKTDLYEIVGALMDKTTGEVSKMNFLETIKEVRNSYDEILASFFTPSGKSDTNSEAE